MPTSPRVQSTVGRATGVFIDTAGDRPMSVDTAGHALEHHGARDVGWSTGG